MGNVGGDEPTLQDNRKTGRQYGLLYQGGSPVGRAVCWPHNNLIEFMDFLRPDCFGMDLEFDQATNVYQYSSSGRIVCGAASRQEDGIKITFTGGQVYVIVKHRS